MPVEHAAIIGAGIAGLTAALALARHGVSSDIYEQASELTEVGAGLQVSPNASRILDTLGILGEIERQWLEPQFIRLVSGGTLKSLAAVPAGEFARQRWGAPHGVLHRATLQKALLSAVIASPLCTLHLGAKIAHGRMPEGNRRVDVVIGADGVWSAARQRITQAPSPRFSGNVAYRFRVDPTSAPAFLDKANVCAFLGPSAHLVCYPLRETDDFNMVAIIAGQPASQNWANATSDHQLKVLGASFKGWNRQFTSLLSDIEPSCWPLYEATEGNWHNGTDTVLIGDAAHAMMPFAAQGAALAIEDAFELAALLSRYPANEALPRFALQRMPRVAKVRKRGALNRFAFHAGGPVRIVRDVVLSLKPPQSLAADLDWIYSYRPVD
jgi:salicylate hydroxylase